MPAIGYENPDQSHFNSRHFWEVGALDPRLRPAGSGASSTASATPDNPLQGLSLDGELSPALATARVPVSAIDGPGDYDFWAPGVWGEVEELDARGDAGDSARTPAADAGLQQAGADRAGRQAPAAADAVRRQTSRARWPTGRRWRPLPKRLAALAAMLAAGLPMLRRFAHARRGLRHPRQPGGRLAKGLKMTADSLLAFQRDLEARGLADRVLVHVWSEFGRRGEENGSAGTDHGAAGAGFLMGTRARGQMIGEFPGLGGLDGDGNLAATADFRGVYCALLEQWFGVDANAMMPGVSAFLARPALLKRDSSSRSPSRSRCSPAPHRRRSRRPRACR